MDIASFDLNLPKAFDALSAERHVTRAEVRIPLGRSGMSGALIRSRELYEDELFVRTPSGMQPAPRALDLAGPVSDALRLVSAALQADGFDPATAISRNRADRIADMNRTCSARSMSRKRIIAAGYLFR